MHLVEDSDIKIPFFQGFGEYLRGPKIFRVLLVERTPKWHRQLNLLPELDQNTNHQ
jgi:hypothetical protein